ncbi:lasso peptide biosynthesis B2 protein [Streptomyces katsurahamanus]|uniref:Lasso peptide biosynthesis B2 protein n=1 Tax=Streptomyces katsurahamanus TaxID=2577098 RepID=A0ABW9NUX1_9ACTN|nr:lasso peptide biosynthesis B2 protein [Streptomyces katsurahamanus]MQS37048.1 lasso peptide biosynthesis B2 protein [Streptomyces katsurahamanus]
MTGYWRESMPLTGDRTRRLATHKAATPRPAIRWLHDRAHDHAHDVTDQLDEPHASPARTACLEESAAAVLLLASRRLSVTWCHGVAPDPVRLHAWLRTQDEILVAEPHSTLAYTPALTIGARHQRQP